MYKLLSILSLFIAIGILTSSITLAATTPNTVAAPYDPPPNTMTPQNSNTLPQQSESAPTQQEKAPSTDLGGLSIQHAAEAEKLAEIEAEKARNELANEAQKAFDEKAYAKAQRLWRSLAQKGDARAMLGLGILYNEGLGTKANHKEALAWFRQAADGNQPEAMYQLGRMLEEGRGTARHVDTAAVWFRRAAEQGYAPAQYHLGLLYQRGEGLVPSAQEAAAWFSRAATQHHVEALAMLGHLYRQGLGVEKNLPRSTLLLYGAAMRGHKGATLELLDMAKEHYKNKLPQITLFGVDLGLEAGVQRSNMRASLSLAGLKPHREDVNFVCDVYDLQNKVPGAVQMAACYSPSAPRVAQQSLGFLKIDYPVKDLEGAKGIQSMVEQRFGPPTAGENNTGYLWNLGNVIVATQYVPEANQVGLMYILPRVYHEAIGE